MGRGYFSEVIIDHFLLALRGPDLNPKASPGFREGQEMKFSFMLRVEELDFMTY